MVRVDGDNLGAETYGRACYIGGRIKGTLGDIDPLNKVPLKRARSRVQKGYPLRGLPNTTP